MRTGLLEKFIMKIKMQRDILPRKAGHSVLNQCAPPKYNYTNKIFRQSERVSLCFLKGSLTIEAALVLPFFLMILLAFFSFFSQYASAAALQVQAAAEARKMGVTLGCLQREDSADVTIYKTKKLENIWFNPFYQKNEISTSATCRAWIGFTQLEENETYVYITPEGSVYHLYADCTHLDLSVQRVTLAKAKTEKNLYRERYLECEICETGFGPLVYITSEGNRYHARRSCSGLKRTVRQVPLREVENRNCCMRCAALED